MRSVFIRVKIRLHNCISVFGSGTMSESITSLGSYCLLLVFILVLFFSHCRTSWEPACNLPKEHLQAYRRWTSKLIRIVGHRKRGGEFTFIIKWRGGKLTEECVEKVKENVTEQAVVDEYDQLLTPKTCGVELERIDGTHFRTCGFAWTKEELRAYEKWGSRSGIRRCVLQPEPPIIDLTICESPKVVELIDLSGHEGVGGNDTQNEESLSDLGSVGRDAYDLVNNSPTFQGMFNEDAD